MGKSLRFLAPLASTCLSVCLYLSLCLCLSLSMSHPLSCLPLSLHLSCSLSLYFISWGISDKSTSGRHALWCSILWGGRSFKILDWWEVVRSLGCVKLSKLLHPQSRLWGSYLFFFLSHWHRVTIFTMKHIQDGLESLTLWVQINFFSL